MTLSSRPLGQPFSEPATDDSVPVARPRQLPTEQSLMFRQPPGEEVPDQATTHRPIGDGGLLPFSNPDRPL
ncbi:hypothetical protein [Kitasatospora sp. NPDC057015]|uniref:hypothetical protein n=1 Tax=Kitasatospora sp. NPDC057015 TaxID=3346001 RepID=UPI003634F408